MLVQLYRACLKHSVQTYRGGDRFMRIVRTLAPELRSYPVSLDGLRPFYIDLSQPTMQDVELFTNPVDWEPHNRAIFRALIRPTDVVVDVGANLGRHTVLFDALAAEVIAVEPNPVLVSNLRRTCTGLSHTTLHTCALGESKGSVAMDLPIDHAVARVSTTRGGTIPMERLDDLVERADFLKVDVEGFEAPVFRGAPRLLNHAGAPTILFEELQRDSAAHDVLETYTQAHYQFWAVPREGGFVVYEDRPDFCDILAVPAARVPFVRERLRC